MFDQPAIFLVCTGQKAWNINKGNNWDGKSITKAHKARRLPRGIAVEHPGEQHRLVRHEANGASSDAAETRDNVLCVGGRQLEKIALVGNLQYQLFDVVGFVGIVRDERIEGLVDAVRS